MPRFLPEARGGRDPSAGKIDRRTGKVVWKLGGTETPRSLDVMGDPYGANAFGGQHDARLLPDGTISVYDLSGAPLVTRFRVDEEKGTARLVQSFSDPDIPGSFCCGSARRIESGDWLVAWGGNGLVGGYDRNGKRLFELRTNNFSYRANLASFEDLSREELREAMDTTAARGS